MKSKFSNRNYQQMQRQRRQLPAWNACDRILNELARSQVVVIVGDTGCGKTTQVCFHLMLGFSVAFMFLSDCI